MKTTISDIFTGDELIEVKFDKFMRERITMPDDFMFERDYGRPDDGEKVLVIEHGELVLATYIKTGTDGVYWFDDWDTFRSVYKTDGWVRLSKFTK